jgi:Icc-related predicted phosphoesterase
LVAGGIKENFYRYKNMKAYRGKLLELPKNGKAIIITDLHGNLKDYNKYISIWEEYDSKTHLIITGDFIHGGEGYTDNSLKILDSMMEKFEKHQNFHVLLGNHELSHLTGIPVYKGFENQKLRFEELLRLKYGNKWENKLDEYLEFFKNLPLAVKTESKVLVSHAGPSMNIHNVEELVNITNAGYFGNSRLSDLLWNRPEDFSEEELNSFLKTVGCEFSIVGHTPVDGFEIVYQKQMIISSSFSDGRKAYIELDLGMDITMINNLIKMIKYLE